MSENEPEIEKAERVTLSVPLDEFNKVMDFYRLVLEGGSLQGDDEKIKERRN